MQKYVLAIDPGTTKSGVCLVAVDSYMPLWCAKLDNELVLNEVRHLLWERNIDESDCNLVVERMHNPLSADSNVFLTCEWIGRFDILFKQLFGHITSYLFRHEEYKILCANIYPRNDKGIKQALVERFAYGQPNFGKGNAKNPGWFYGFSGDTWSAYAIAITFIDKELNT